MKYAKPLHLFRDLVKASSSGSGRLLGLDVGDKYVGLAVSDANNATASPLSVLVRKKSTIELMAIDFQCLISELSLIGFVVGCPFDRHRRCPQSVIIKLFIDELCKNERLEGMKYTFWDECFTSKSVELMLKPLSFHPVVAKTMTDKFAAVGILQGYLDHVNQMQ
ncbi:putative pre-16S rRNA nuclease [Impatiens glandulifera]|uniref:putative pre-16S rRNA nuclease n=1 Tax=Impatiens glandulifera TaxID=253017 RepID=UPI001FB16B21|nr:putative pre-16S rRNA nuclease [Impatiens glandulifera]